MTTNAYAFTISASVTGGNGTITCTTPVNSGENSTCTITANTGYQLDTLTDNSTDVKSQVSGSTYTISNVTADHAVGATFSLITFPVNASVSGGNGTITCTTPVNYGSSSTCTITANTGYQLDTLTDNSIDVKSQVSGSTYTISDMLASHTVVATFSSVEGTQKWAFTTGIWIYSSPAIGTDGTIYVGSDAGYFYAINPDGSQKWRTFRTGGGVNSSPAIGTDGTIYVGSYDGNLYAFNPGDGSQKWAFLAGKLDSSPAIGADGTIYVGSDDGSLYAINPANGSQKWAFQAGGAIHSSPAIGADGTIYVGSDDGSLYAINPVNGSQKWAFHAGGAIGSSPAINGDGTIYVGSNDKFLYAINPGDGSQKWAFHAGGAIGSSPAIGADGTIYVGSDDGSLYAINPVNGSQKWAFHAGGAIGSSPAVGADGTIYVGSNDKFLYAINPGDGSQKWAFQTGSRIHSSPAIGADGTIYVGSYDNSLYAVLSASPGLVISSWPMFHHDLLHTGSVPTVAVNGVCGPANGGTFTSAPTANLCSAGTASAVAGSGQTWTWTCAGWNNGTTANCQANQANIQTWTVTPSAGSNGTINPNTAQTVNNGATTSFTVTPNASYSASVGGTCGGTLNGTTYTTNAITTNCTVQATFTLVPNGVCGSANGGTFTSAPTTNLCGAGTASQVAGSGPWTWTCQGANSTAQCQANLSSGGGIKKWAFATNSGIHSSPAVGADGTIYVGSDDGYLYAINPGNGSRKWRFLTAVGVFSSPAIGSDGTVYVGSLDNNLYAINPGTGTQKWAFPTGNSVYSSPAIGSDGTIYVGSDDGYLYAINPVNGSQKWRFLTAVGVFSSPAIGSDGTVYVGSDDGSLYAINPGNGSQKWRFLTGGAIGSSPAIGSDGTVYVGSDDGYLYAINPGDGSQVWRFLTGGAIGSSPAIGADGTVYVGSDDGYLYAINPGNGSQVWRFLTGGAIGSSPAIGSDGTVYVGSDDKFLYAINPGGTKKWAFHPGAGGGIGSSPAIGADGTIYVGSYDNSLYAVQSASQGLATSSWPMFHHDLLHTGSVPANGVCGSANGGNFTSAPTTNLCSQGTPSALAGSGPWTWTCAVSGGTTANCQANKGNPQTWTVTFTPSAGNNTISCIPSTVNSGSNSICTITLSTSYQLATLTDNGVDVKSQVSGSTYTISNVTANHTVVATFFNPATDAACGSANGGTFTAAPTSNLCVNGNPSAVSGSGPWTWTCALAGGTTVSCQANLQAWTVTSSVTDGNGTISCASPVNNGLSSTCIISQGSQLATLTDNGIDVKSQVSGSTYTISNVTANHTVVASFVSSAFILWRNISTGENTLWSMDGSTRTGTSTLDPLPGAWRMVGTADFNNDGKPDILWRNISTGENMVWYMNGATHTSATLESLTDLNWKMVGTADFDGDGKPDILWHSTSDGRNMVWYMNGATHVRSADLPPPVTDQNWKIVGTADFNNDGTPDIVWRNSATGQNAVWYMDGINRTGSALLDTLADQNWKMIVGATDLNNDGQPDILWRNISTGANMVWYMNKATHLSSADLNPVTDQNMEMAGQGSYEAPPPPVPGQCGSANGGNFTSAPTTNLCSVGTASAVTGLP